MLRHNTTLKKTVRKTGTEHLPYGLNYGMFCAQGLQNKEGVFSGACKGDSGGPLQTVDMNNEDRTTLLGIVSGGIGCGKGIPGWFTKVSFHIKWIRCIIDKSVQFNNNQKKVEEACKGAVQPEPTCVEEKDLVFGVEEFQKIKNKKFEICENTMNDDDVDSDVFDLREEDKHLQKDCSQTHCTWRKEDHNTE